MSHWCVKDSPLSKVIISWLFIAPLGRPETTLSKYQRRRKGTSLMCAATSSSAQQQLHKSAEGISTLLCCSLSFRWCKMSQKNWHHSLHWKSETCLRFPWRLWSLLKLSPDSFLYIYKVLSKVKPNIAWTYTWFSPGELWNFIKKKLSRNCFYSVKIKKNNYCWKFFRKTILLHKQSDNNT
jgi:hypothetical protein